MTCELWEAKIDAYVDGELAQDEQRALREHLASCAACSQEALGRMELKRAVHAAGKRYQPSGEFRARVAQQTWAKAADPRQAGQRPASTFEGWAWMRDWRPRLAAVAVVLIAFGISILHVRGMQRQQVMREIADLHASNLASANPVDVVSTDKHTVKPWFAGKLPFTFDLPELAGTQFELIGGRMVFVEQEPAALLVYGIRKHKITVLISLDRDGVEKLGSSEASVHSFHLETWSQGGLRYVVISDAAAPDVQALAEMFRTVAAH